ncbi:sensor histidine kinase [Pedobacter sp. GR22-6]|uniref:sensor histidine kinase n=1 Tax=Pedobacter sp. GR22-6 TaxID=3127957 RepID=UPI00307DF120
MQTQLDLYQKAVPLAQLGIWERNLLTGEMYWNQVVYEIFEVPLSFHPSVYESLAFYTDPHLVGSMIEDAMNTRLPQQGKMQLLTATGKTKWVRINVLASFEGKICSSICGTIEDISNYQHMYNILEEREQRFQQAFDNAPIGMAMLSPSAELLKLNESLLSNLEYVEGELEGRQLQEIVHEEDRENLDEMLEKLISGAINSFTLEMRLFAKTGKPVWVMFSQSAVSNKAAEVLYLISHIKDISERRKHSEILLKERKRLDNIIKGTGVGTWEWDIPSDQLLYNRRAAELLGFDKHLVELDQMQDWQQLIHPDDRERNLNQLRDCFEKKSKFYCCECRMLHHSGNWIWMEIRGKVIKWSADDQPLLMLGTFADIHARKSLEEQQTVALKHISAQNRRLLDFAHIVSHNLRSHTGNIEMIADALAEEKDEVETSTMIDMLRTNVGNLQETLSNLNEVIKIQEKKDLHLMELNLLQEVNKSIAALAEPIRESKASLQINVASELKVNFDPAYLQSILQNLISNCLKYHEPQRQLQIDITASNTEPLVLKVCDNGLGLDMKMHGHKLFGMYKTFHGNADAKGIGLFLVKNQVEAMGGKISAESELGKGSTFTLQFI